MDITRRKKRLLGMELVVLIILAVWGFGILLHIFENGIKDGLLRLLLILFGFIVIYWLVSSGTCTLNNPWSE